MKLLDTTHLFAERALIGASDRIDLRGCRKPETLLAIERRNRIIVGMKAALYPAMSANEAAFLIRQALDRYRASGWQRDRAEVSCPERLAGRPQAFCWHVLKAIDYVPSQRTIWNALKATIRFQSTPTNSSHQPEI